MANLVGNPTMPRRRLVPEEEENLSKGLHFVEFHSILGNESADSKQIHVA